MKLHKFNEAMLRLIDNIINSKGVKIMGWVSLSYILIYTYLNNFPFFILSIKMFFGGLVVVFFITFVISIIYLIYVISKTLLTFGYYLIRYILGYENDN